MFHAASVSHASLGEAEAVCKSQLVEIPVAWHIVLKMRLCKLLNSEMFAIQNFDFGSLFSRATKVRPFSGANLLPRQRARRNLQAMFESIGQLITKSRQIHTSGKLGVGRELPPSIGSNAARVA